MAPLHAQRDAGYGGPRDSASTVRYRLKATPLMPVAPADPNDQARRALAIEIA
jgi:hypothetical protein